MQQYGRFSLKFLSIFMRISSSINPITLIWVSLERSGPPAELEYKWVMPFLDVGHDIRNGTKANSHHRWLRAAQVPLG